MSKEDDTSSTCSTTSWSSSGCSSSYVQRKRFFTAVVENVPRKFLVKEEIAKILKQIPNLQTENVTVFKNNVVTIKSADRYVVERLTRSLPNLVGQPLKIYQPASKDFSCVIKGIPLEISAITMVNSLREQNVEVKCAFRIKSRATEEFTRMFRIISEDKECIDRLIRSGFKMGKHQYRVEPPKLPVTPVK